jgi:phenylalanyl-tRNA synthetase beta chain
LKISLNWVKDYVNLEGLSTEEIVSNLTMCGLEVEDYTDQAKTYENFVIGYVKEREKHPNADKLSLCRVTDGSQEFQVVCGAPNVAAGQTVVFAKEGAVVPNGGFKISKAKIRGVESFGMICAEDELGLSDNHSGIMELDSSFKIGQPMAEAFGLNDVVMEIGITPNRPDALSHIGVARDLAAIFNRELKMPAVELNESDVDVNTQASVEIVDTVNCPRYSAKVVKGVQVKESPEWMKKRLKAVGLRPISNIVDITNYIMFEFGQPMHAFDLDKVGGSKIIVRKAGADNKFVTLDSKERVINPDSLMICDGNKPVAVAGVMGGENSEISNSTANILIESAYFNPSSVRKTSKQLGLSTDSSYRFERGTDPNNTLYAAERAAALMVQLGGGAVCKGAIDVYPNRISKKIVTLRESMALRVLGYKVATDKIKSIVTRLGMEILSEKEGIFELTIPTFRPDIEREIDVIEEIARINGYDNIPAVERIANNLDKKTDESEYADKVRNTAVALGFFEIQNNSLVSEKLAGMTGKSIPVLNYQSIDMSNLRTSLVPGLLQTIAKNINYGEKNLQFFEIGNIFKLISEKIVSFDDFTEERSLIFAITGNSERKEWHSKERGCDFYDLKGLVDSFIVKIGLEKSLSDDYNTEGNGIYSYYYSKRLGNKEAGLGGKISKEILKQFDILQDVFCFEFKFDELKKLSAQKSKYKEPLKFPKVERDFAFIFDKNISNSEIKDYILGCKSKLLKNVRLFDLFESDTFGSGKRSLAYTLEFFDETRTLTDEEVEKEFTSLTGMVKKKFNAELRGV